MSNRFNFWLRRFAFATLVLVAFGSGILADHPVVQAARQMVGLASPSVGPLTQAEASAIPDRVPGVLNYQGVVRNATGQPLTNGEYQLTFRLYDSVASVNPPLWEEQHIGVVVRDGRFAATLGYTNTLPVTLFSASPDRFVGVTVQGFAEMQPRLRLASVPYAMQPATLLSCPHRSLVYPPAAPGCRPESGPRWKVAGEWRSFGTRLPFQLHKAASIV